jgi:hypothetical protein
MLSPTRGGPILWPLRTIQASELQARQAGLRPLRGLAQAVFLRQRPRSARLLLAPDMPVNLPWNAVGQPGLTDLPVAFPRVVHELRPYPPTYFRLSGTTRDSTGAALANCVVEWFDTATDVKIGSTTSDANGFYEFRTAGQPPNAYYLVAYKAGSPDVAGTTLNTLTGV